MKLDERFIFLNRYWRPNLPNMDSMNDNVYVILCDNHLKACEDLECFVAYLLDIDLDHIDTIDKHSNTVTMEDGIKYVFLDHRLKNFVKFTAQFIESDDFFSDFDMFG